MINVGWNFGSKTKCPLCKESDDKQEHLLECCKFNKAVDAVQGEPDVNFMKNVERALRQREILLEKQETEEDCV